MLRLQLNSDSKKGLKLLLLGAHCDDIEIGCGGSVLKLINEHKITEVKWIVFASNEHRKKEAISCANHFLDSVENKEITVLEYRDAFLNTSADEIKEFFEAIKNRFNPDLIFTHYKQDKHQDHKLISDLTWNTFRNHLILEYEIPKYDADLGQPNFFFKLSKEQAEKKVSLLINNYKSQTDKHWFDKETFLSLMRIRGLESANENKYSEAFHLRKGVL